jgi:hypothetical protein
MLRMSVEDIKDTLSEKIERDEAIEVIFAQIKMT